MWQARLQGFHTQLTVRSNTSHHKQHVTTQSTFNSSSPFTVNGDESAETKLRPHGRSQDRHLATSVNHEFNFHIVRPTCQKPWCRRADGAYENGLPILRLGPFDLLQGVWECIIFTSMTWLLQLSNYHPLLGILPEPNALTVPEQISPPWVRRFS